MSMQWNFDQTFMWPDFEELPVTLCPVTTIALYDQAPNRSKINFRAFWAKFSCVNDLYVFSSPNSVLRYFKVSPGQSVSHLSLHMGNGEVCRKAKSCVISKGPCRSE